MTYKTELASLLLQSPLRMHRGSRALTEDAEGPRMSMAMRRQLGIAPAKSPSKASSAAARELLPIHCLEGHPPLCVFRPDQEILRSKAWSRVDACAHDGEWAQTKNDCCCVKHLMATRSANLLV